MSPEFADQSAPTLPLWLVRQTADGPDLPDGVGNETVAAWAGAQGFSGKLGQICLLPGPDGRLSGALYGLGRLPGQPARERYLLAPAAERLPAGNWRIANLPEGFDPELGALGWLFVQYRFARYKKVEAPAARLVCPDGVDADRLAWYTAVGLVDRAVVTMRELAPDAIARARHLLTLAGSELVTRMTGVTGVAR